MTAYSQWTVLPLLDLVGRRILRRPAPSLEAAAVKTWEISPADEYYSRPAFFLSAQLDRVTGWEFSDEHPRRAMEGGVHWVNTPTRAFLLKDALLVDGALYANDFSLRYCRRSSLPTLSHINVEIDTGAFYCTDSGIRWFGNWLMADCLTYPIARDVGKPITVGRQLGQHTLDYERLQEMEPARLECAYIREAVVFHDVGQNAGKKARAAKRREMLLSKTEVKPHPGVFILRGRTGAKRLLVNERELAQYLHDRRGFKIIDPTKMTVAEIMAACGGADTVVGVEGSGLMHGIGVLGSGGKLLTLQPSNRFVHVYKDVADRDDFHFGFVVGKASGEEFRIDPAEVEQTLDLFPN